MNIRNAVPGEPLPLGRRWEHNATRIVFDISAWVIAFGAGTARLLHQRQGDDAPYPVAILRTDADGTENNATGTLILWDVTRADAALPCHYGRAELRYYSGTEGAEEFLVKSEIYKTAVEDALGGVVADAPEEEKAWLDELLEAADAISGAQEAAAEAIEAAQGAASDAQEAALASASSATDAADSANLATAAVIAARAAQAAAEEARTALDNFTGATAAVPFANDAAVTLTDGDGFLVVLEAPYAETTGDNAELHAEIPLSVTTATTRSDAGGWTINEATVTAHCYSDSALLPRQPQWTLGDGAHTLHAQWIFAVLEAESHVIQVKLRITGGAASVAAGDAVMFVSGIVESSGSQGEGE